MICPVTGQLTLDALKSLTAEQAAAVYERGKEAVVWALLQLAALARSADAPAPLAGAAPDPSTPSAMIAPYSILSIAPHSFPKGPGCDRLMKP